MSPSRRAGSSATRRQAPIASRARGASPTLAVLWCSPTERGPLFLYVADARGQRLLVRRAALTGRAGAELQSARYEALALIARGLVRELARGGVIGVAALVGACAAAQRAAAWLRARLRAGRLLRGDGGHTRARSGSRAASDPAPERVGGCLRVRQRRAAQRPGGGFATARAGPRRCACAPVATRASSPVGPAGAAAGARVGRAERPGRRPLAERPRQLRRGRAPLARLSWALHRRLRVFASAGATIVIDRERYVVEATGSPTVLLSPFRVQPGLRLGASVGVW